MKLIDDTLKENGKWSRSSLMILFTFWSNVIFVAFEVHKTGKFPDLPQNWLALMIFLYGINKGATAVNNHTAAKGATDVSAISALS